MFGRVGPTSDVGVESLDDFLNNQITELIEDRSVIDRIDSEIQEVTEKAGNERSKNRNLKSNKLN